MLAADLAAALASAAKPVQDQLAPRLDQLAILVKARLEDSARAQRASREP
jgi:hypothetical protein